MNFTSFIHFKSFMEILENIKILTDWTHMSGFYSFSKYLRKLLKT
jgi:hypothetical protein